MEGSPDHLWWRDGVIYQIYPRSFQDSNGDGLGDLPGITTRLDHLATLGVDAIWLSPFYPTPDRDFGYDISDHCAVDPRFGTLDDLDHLLGEAHRRGMRVILDLVLNHTSDLHPWFMDSRSGRDSPKRDWYIWADPAPGGGPPNNWQASFGGRAWTFDPSSGQYYLHSFTAAQPDVNWRNPAVRQAQLDVVRFWLRRGVDGFRLDVFNACFKDEDLRDNPPKFGLRGFDRQRHVHDMDQPELFPLLAELRAIVDEVPGRYMVGETYLATPTRAAGYAGPDRLHAAFSFDFIWKDLFYPWNPRFVLRRLLRRDAAFGEVWPTTVLGNHDQYRPAWRYSRGDDDRMVKVAMAVLLTARGTPFLYYGEEIGMRDLPLRRSEIMDPPGRKYWPIYRGRDVCRGPMQWDATAQSGFTSGRPWLRVHPDFRERNLAAQQADPASLYHFTRRLIALRRATPALVRGDFTPFGPVPRGVLAYVREWEGRRVLAALNFGPRSKRLRRVTGRVILSTHERPDPGGDLRLGPFEVCLIELE